MKKSIEVKCYRDQIFYDISDHMAKHGKGGNGLSPAMQKNCEMLLNLYDRETSSDDTT